MVPGVTGSGVWVLVTARSATAITGLVAVNVLSLGNGSGVEDEMRTVFVIVPVTAEPTLTTSTRVAEVVSVSVGAVHWSPAPKLQDQPGAPEVLTDANVVPAGRVSVSTTLAALLG